MSKYIDVLAYNTKVDTKNASQIWLQILIKKLVFADSKSKAT
jgi:hypothetical protein